MRWRAHVVVLASLGAAGAVLWAAGSAGSSQLTLPVPNGRAIGAWFNQVGPAGAVICGLRALGLGLVAWLAAGTAVDAVGVLLRSAALRRLGGSSLPTPLRAALQRGGLATLALGVVAAPADPPPAPTAEERPVPAREAVASMVPLSDGSPAATTTAPSPPSIAPRTTGAPALLTTTTTTTTTTSAVPPASTSSTSPKMSAAPPADTSSTSPQPPVAAAPERVAAIADPQPDTVVVVPGDSLWSLAEDLLTDQAGRPVSDAEVARYWAQVVAANRPLLRSGDPDVIYPGETVVLPAPDPLS